MCTEPYAMQAPRPARSRPPGGFTLIELLFFILIVGIAVAGITQVYVVSAAATGDPMIRKQALTIAEGMMDEIALQPFAATGSSYTGTTRSLFDHASAYDGYTSNGVYTLDGQAVSGLAGYRLAVSVAHPGGAIGGVPASAIWLITVTVTDSASNSTVLTGYRFNYG